MTMIKTRLSEDYPALSMLAGVDYVLEDVNAGQLLQSPGLVAEVVSMGVGAGVRWDSYDEDDRILITRPGGIGDLLFLTPLISYLDALGWRVVVSTCKGFWPVLEGNPHVSALVDYPLSAEAFEGYKNSLWLENAVEAGGLAEELHMADLFFRLAGLEAPKGFPMHCRAQRIPHSALRTPHSSLHIGVHLTASAKNRQYNRGAELMDVLLANTDWVLHVFGAPGEVRTVAHDRIVNHTQEGLSLRDTLALVGEMDGFVGVDSGLLHAAGGMGVPCVALFAAFSGDLRCRYHGRTVIVQATAECAPCFHHQRGSYFPKGCPGVRAGRCVVLDAISPLRILEELKLLLENP
jgi:ADP-heptose:LPS heptosyltransferase